MEWRTSCCTELFLASATLLALCAGCASTPAASGFHPAMLPFASESVSSIMAANTGGTAVYLGEGRWITLREVLKGASTIRIDGKTTRIRVVRGGKRLDRPEGDMEQALADWVIFEAPEAGDKRAKKPAHYDPALPVAPGQKVYLIGYPCAPGTMDRRLTLVGTRVVTRPWWLPKGLLYLSGPTTDLAGLCGGAAVLVQEDEVVMVGIFYGPCKTWWPEWPWRSLLLVVRPPK